MALALFAALSQQYYKFHRTEPSLFLFAIAVTVWYAGVGPAILATVLSILCFLYFFAPPIYSFAFTFADVPAIVILLSFAGLIVRFSAARRCVEGQLLRAHDELLADINERKKAEEKLRRSEAYLVEAERLSKTASWAWSPVTQQSLYWSEEMFRIFGFDPQQGLPPAETFWERVHPEDRDDMVKLMRVAVHEKREYVHEHRIVMPDGTIKHIHAVGHPLLDAAGEIVEYVGTLADVTEHKQAEDALRRSESYLAEAQRLSHTGSWAYSHATERAIYWSEETFRIFGLGPQRSDPPFYDEFIRLIHPEDRDRFRENTRRCFREKVGFTQEYRLMLPDGTVKYIHEIGHPVLDGSEKLVEYLGTLIDVTERWRAEEELLAAETRFRASVDHLADALFIHDDLDEHGRVIDVNQQACDSLGYTREELIGMTASHYDAHVDAVVMSSIKERLARGETFCFESAHRRKDGTVFPVEVRVRPFWHGDHRFGLAVVRDITDRKRAEQERERLRQLEADLARLNRVSMMGELAASLAHEIKQPIAAAATNARTGLRWLQREPPDAGEAREALSRIVNDAARATEIIERNRSLYRRGIPKRETINLNEVVREIIALLRDAASRQSVSIRAELDGDVPTVTADRVQMQQVLMNLMLNGIEAMKDTGGELMIRSKETEGRQILLSVSDAGVGLPNENADRVFEAFFTTKEQGTGMGLSISRRIIESHGGRLWATANSGRGATFHLTVPTDIKAE